MMYTVKKLMFSAFSSTLLFMLIARKAFSRISLGSGYIGEFFPAYTHNMLILLLFSGIFNHFALLIPTIHICKHYYYACFRKWRTAMLKIKNLGYNSTHTHGINMERPNGMGHYLMLLVKSAAYFEFSENAICCSCCRHEAGTTADELLKGNLPYDRNARHPGMIRQYVNTPAFIIYTADAPIYYYSDDVYVNDWINFYETDKNSQDEADENNQSRSDSSDWTVDGSISEFMRSLNVPFNRLTLLSDHTELSQLIRDLRQEFHQTGTHHEEILDAKLRTILYKYSDAYHLETQLSDKLKVHRPLFREIRNGIYSRHSSKKTLSELAEDASLSVSYFQHIYKELFGVSVIQDIIRSRIERACYLLTVTPDSVAHIAEVCGYENVEHFNRQFKEITGFSPNQYRKKK